MDWVLLSNVAANYLLPDAFVNETFNFFGKEIDGQAEIEPLLDR